MTQSMEVENPRIKRRGCQVEYKFDRFLIKDKKSGQQYAHLYHTRLVELRPYVLESARKKWQNITDENGNVPREVQRVLDLQLGELCYLTGTLYKDMPLKPNILKELSAERYILPPPPLEKYLSNNDEIILEDEHGRVKISGTMLESSSLVTGVVVAILGRERAGGEFEVQDFSVAGFPPQNPIISPFPPTPIGQSNLFSKFYHDDDKYVALVSGINFGSDSLNQLHLQLLIDFLSGELGTREDHCLVSKVARVIIAGNSFDDKLSQFRKDVDASKKQTTEQAVRISESVLNFDQYIAGLCANVPVELLPGEHDPANYFLPQQPLLKAMFPQTASFSSSFISVTNPYQSNINGIEFLGTSGQPIQDILKYVSSDDQLALLENTLRWRHLVPTAPDTLACYPFKMSDPFIISELPHVYFCGNSNKFETKLLQEGNSIVRMIMIPIFSETSTIVLLNLRTLECQPIQLLTITA